MGCRSEKIVGCSAHNASGRAQGYAYLSVRYALNTSVTRLNKIAANIIALADVCSCSDKILLLRYKRSHRECPRAQKQKSHLP